MNMKFVLMVPSIAGIATLLAGCSSTPTETPPSYQVPYYQGPQAYRYPPQQISAPPAVSAPLTPQTAPPASTYTQAQPAPAPDATQMAPAPHMDSIPASPGPDYVWMPSYWTIGVGGGWVWVGGHYVLRQGAAEEQLRAARGMLEQARIGLSSKKVRKIDDAIEEINDALKSR